MLLTTSGVARNFSGGVLGRISTIDLPPSLREKHIRYVAANEEPPADLSGYRAILSHKGLTTDQPMIDRLRESAHFTSGDVVYLDGHSGFVRSLYRPTERHHSLFVTERCNSNCLMCSQPPKDTDDVVELAIRNRELISLMAPAPGYLTITGGEPTLLGPALFDLIEQLKWSLPQTEVHMLTNGRNFAWPSYSSKFGALQHPNLSLGVPLYSDFAGDHDYIVQAEGAFDQTISGLHQAARHGIRVEIRVVLHRLSVSRLGRLMEFIYRNLTFVEHVALMGLEYVGYTPRNAAELWIDPFDYQDELEEAVHTLTMRGITVSIYNHQLCVLRPTLWKFAAKSISDWKNLYLSECQTCSVSTQCGGFFRWSNAKHSAHIHALRD